MRTADRKKQRQPTHGRTGSSTKSMITDQVVFSFGHTVLLKVIKMEFRKYASKVATGLKNMEIFVCVLTELFGEKVP